MSTGQKTNDSWRVYITILTKKNVVKNVMVTCGLDTYVEANKLAKKLNKKVRKATGETPFNVMKEEY